MFRLWHVGLEIGDQRLSAHVFDYRLRRVDRSLVLVVFQQVLEDAAEHFWIDAHLRVARIVLVDCEIVLRKEHKEIVEIFAREPNGLLVCGIPCEESAVQVGYLHLADAGYAGVEDIPARRAIDVQRPVEERFKDGIEKIVLLPVARMVVQVEHEFTVTVVPRLLRAEPSLFLEKVKEHDAPEHLLHVVAHGLVVVVKLRIDFLVRNTFRNLFPLPADLLEALAGDVLYDTLVIRLVLGEELVGKCLDVESSLDVVHGGTCRRRCGCGKLDEVLRGGAATLVRSEKKRKTLGLSDVLVAFAAEGEAPVPSFGVRVVEDHERALESAEDATYDALYRYAITREEDMICDGDVEYLYGAEVDSDAPVCDDRTDADFFRVVSDARIIKQFGVVSFLEMFLAEDREDDVLQERIASLEFLFQVILNFLFVEFHIQSPVRSARDAEVDIRLAQFLANVCYDLLKVRF